MLTTKMKNFVDEYFVDFNGSAAVRRAGYRSKNPHKMAGKLMNHPLVRQEIEKKKKEREEKTELTADYVINKLVAIADEEQSKNPQASLRSLELLGKYLGLYKDRQEISGPDGDAIQMETKKTEENIAAFKSKLNRLARRAGTAEVTEFPKSAGDGEA